jgi:hypothetical protein
MHDSLLNFRSFFLRHPVLYNNRDLQLFIMYAYVITAMKDKSVGRACFARQPIKY